MADIAITDQLQLTADIHISDAAPFALSKLKALKFDSLPIIGDFSKPLDHCSLRETDVGINVSTPSLLLGNAANLVISGGSKATLSIRTVKDETLFDGETPANDIEILAPEIPIKQGEGWIGLKVDTRLGAKVSAAFDGFGVAVQNDAKVGLGTFLLLNSSAGHLPTLKESLQSLFEKFSVSFSAAAIRQQPPGTVNSAELSGTLQFSASYTVPVSVAPLASLDLPFNYKINVEPALDLQLTGTIAMSGEFDVRCHKISSTQVVIGIYKKKSTTLTVDFLAKAGVGANIGKVDVVAAVLKAVLGTPDSKAVGLSEEQAEELNSALKECVDLSFSLAANASCSATVADEAAVEYAIDLSGGNEQTTDQAIGKALQGDWTTLDTLSNAKPVRNVLKELHEKTHKINFNLLGIYNAISIGDYMKSCTILHDGNGQVVLVDRAKASRLVATDMPYLAKPDKLRSVLSEAFLATITYGATAESLGPKLEVRDFKVKQTYVDYKAELAPRELRRLVLLARALELITNGAWDQIVQLDTTFDHAKVSITAEYGLSSLLRLFYSDPKALTAYSKQYLDETGRGAKLALLDPTEDNAKERITALKSDRIWKQMNDSGNAGRFRLIPELASFHDTAIAAIAADWTDVCWWGDKMLPVTERLTNVLQELKSSPTTNPLDDLTLSKKRRALENALTELAGKTISAFSDGWGLLVMYKLSEATPDVSPPEVSMDIGWNGKFEHYATGPKAALRQGTGG